MRLWCKVTDILFTDQQPQYFFRTRWNEAGSEAKVWYVVYKVVFCLYFLSSIIYTWVLDHQVNSNTSNSWKYIIWMTHWGICLICGALCLETVITITIFLGKNLPARLLLFSWALTTMTYTMAVFITFMYWTLLFHWDSLPSYVNLFVHAFQGVFALLDQMMTNRPWHLFKAWSSLPIPFIYLIFNIIYWAAGGTNNDGDDWVYPVLKWGEEPGMAVLVMFMAVVALPVIHGGFCLITMARDWLYRKIFSDMKMKGDVNSQFVSD